MRLQLADLLASNVRLSADSRLSDLTKPSPAGPGRFHASPKLRQLTILF